MRSRLSLPVALCSFVLMASSFSMPLANPNSPAKSRFIIPCGQFPFEDIKLRHPIDEQCARSGTPATEANRLQNLAKNNFCAPEPTSRLSFSTFDRLQHDAEQRGVSFGNQRVSHPRPLPPNRHTLESIGEGKRVMLEAFVLEAHFADTGSGESVNCEFLRVANNDIHIALVESGERGGCNSVTAEISPHFRPAQWEKIASKSRAMLSALANRPVRITGQLMFDASHSPCGNPNRVRGDPARRSLWEIHPVYKIEIKNGSRFIPFEDFVSMQ